MRPMSSNIDHSNTFDRRILWNRESPKPRANNLARIIGDGHSRNERNILNKGSNTLVGTVEDSLSFQWAAKSLDAPSNSGSPIGVLSISLYPVRIFSFSTCMSYSTQVNILKLPSSPGFCSRCNTSPQGNCWCPNCSGSRWTRNLTPNQARISPRPLGGPPILDWRIVACGIFPQLNPFQLEESVDRRLMGHHYLVRFENSDKGYVPAQTRSYLSSGER